jgi:hypothetical protein
MKSPAFTFSEHIAFTLSRDHNDVLTEITSGRYPSPILSMKLGTQHLFQPHWLIFPIRLAIAFVRVPVPPSVRRLTHETIKSHRLSLSTNDLAPSLY